jgi:hypothetical protein
MTKSSTGVRRPSASASAGATGKTADKAKKRK